MIKRLINWLFGKDKEEPKMNAKKRWTATDIEYLTANYGILELQTIASDLDRSVPSIKSKLYSLKQQNKKTKD
jgi:hypothetical protein